jgi:hypothetical protein
MQSLKKPPFVPLCIDRIAEDCYAISQSNGIDGSMVADPDVEIRIDHFKKIAEPLSYQDRSVRKVVYREPGTVDLKEKNELASSRDRWLEDLLSQGFIFRQQVPKKPEIAKGFSSETIPGYMVVTGYIMV